MTGIQNWTVRLFRVEEGNVTTVHAVLETGGKTLHGRGITYYDPRDAVMQDVGEELAVGRALARLAQQVIAMATLDLEVAEGLPVRRRTEAWAS